MIIYADTATSNKWNYPVKGVHQPDEIQPHMVRLAWLLTEDDGTPVRESCHLIRLPAGRLMASEAAYTTGIFDHQLEARGMRMFEVLSEFAGALSELQGDGKICAHNWGSHKMVLDRSFRYVGMPAREWPEKERTICAMIKASDVVKIPRQSPGGGYKWPTFDECCERMLAKRLMPSQDPISDGIARVRAVQVFKSYIDRL